MNPKAGTYFTAQWRLEDWVDLASAVKRSQPLVANYEYH